MFFVENIIRPINVDLEKLRNLGREYKNVQVDDSTKQIVKKSLKKWKA